MTHPLKDKVVLITGASSGIGEATAYRLAEQGARVVLGARRADRLQKITDTIRSKGGTALPIALDVTDRAEMKAFVQQAMDTFGQVDVMFNNAGIMPLAPMSSLNVEEWDAMIDVNIRGVLNGIAAVLPVMEERGNGHIINTASVGAHAVFAGGTVYCATKYAVWAISDGLRQESKHIRTTIISPGVTTTELGHDISDANSQAVLKELRQDSLSPDAIANAVLYAVSQPDDVDVSEIIVRPLTSTI